MKRLEQHERHFLGQPALVEFQFRPDDDHRTPRIIDALAQQVLAETPAFAFEHIRERLERTIAGARDRTAMTAVIEQGVDGLLQHALFVANDDVRRLELEEVLETVIAVDDAAIEIVQIGRCEAAALERDQRTQIGRDDGQHFEHHPLGAGAGMLEAEHELEPLGQTLADLLALRVEHRFFHFLGQGGQFHAAQKLLDGLGAHAGAEIIGVLLLCASRYSASLRS